MESDLGVTLSIIVQYGYKILRMHQRKAGRKDGKLEQRVKGCLSSLVKAVMWSGERRD